MYKARQKVPCIMRISILEAKFVRKKCPGKYANEGLGLLTVYRSD